jgi:hypothetical protein
MSARAAYFDHTVEKGAESRQVELSLGIKTSSLLRLGKSQYPVGSDHHPGSRIPYKEMFTIGVKVVLIDLLVRRTDPSAAFFGKDAIAELQRLINFFLRFGDADGEPLAS